MTLTFENLKELWDALRKSGANLYLFNTVKLQLFEQIGTNLNSDKWVDELRGVLFYTKIFTHYTGLEMPEQISVVSV